MERTQPAAKPLFSGPALQRLIWPLVGEQFLAVLTGMMDTVMVSNAGETAVSAVSLVDSLNVLMINVFSALAAGGAIVVSQYLGMKDQKNANHAAKQLVFIIAVLGSVLGVICALSRSPLLHFLFGSIDPGRHDRCGEVFLHYRPLLSLYRRL